MLPMKEDGEIGTQASAASASTASTATPSCASAFASAAAAAAAPPARLLLPAAVAVSLYVSLTMVLSSEIMHFLFSPS